MVKCCTHVSSATSILMARFFSQNICRSTFDLRPTRRNFHTTLDDNKHTWSLLKSIDRSKIATHRKKFACLLLNISDESGEHFENHNHLWYNANIRVAVDGSANFLANQRIIHTADIVCGDFDSVDPKLIENLRCQGKETRWMLPKDHKPDSDIKLPRVIETPSQKETDFTKAIWVVMKKRPEIDVLFSLYYADGSRIDHLFGMVNTLHLIKKDVILLNVRSNTLSWLLTPGIHNIQKYRGRELCSLVPFNGIAKVSTQGLEYNIKPNNPLSFGGQISTSNICREDSECIVIETNRELLWSIDIRAR